MTALRCAAPLPPFDWRRFLIAVAMFAAFVTILQMI